MDSLPNEIYQSIFLLLPYETILECTHVCRKWTTTAQECLHSHVSFNTKDELDRFIDHIDDEASRRYQVKSFRLFIKPVHHFDKRSVCHLFPNLHQVEFLQYEGDTTLPDFSSEKMDTTAMISTLESVTEKGDYHFSLHLIEADLCQRLATLYIDYRSKSQHNIIHQLKDIPVLKTLTLILDAFTLTLEDLDRVHQEIPSLVELQIGQIMLVPNRIPVDIRPTSFIKKIRFNFKCTHTSADLTKAYLQYFQYIAKKYTNPENLSMNVLDSVDFTMDDKNKVFDFGWTPLLQSFGPQLKSIKSVDVDPQVNIFKRLDDLGCKLEKLSIYPTQGTLTLAEFVQSNQSKYMRELYMSDVALRPGDSLKETKLVKLTLFASVDDDSLVLNHFLKICPDTLKHLRLESYDIEYDESDDFQCFSLISLKINNDSFGEIGNGVTENVHKCCPNLKELRIEDYL